jgi:hypothetical protein
MEDDENQPGSVTMGFAFTNNHLSSKCIYRQTSIQLWWSWVYGLSKADYSHFSVSLVVQNETLTLGGKTVGEFYSCLLTVNYMILF